MGWKEDGREGGDALHWPVNRHITGSAKCPPEKQSHWPNRDAVHG